MKMGYGLSLQPQQKLVMTPELRQAIAILQMNTQELSRHLEEQLLENPVLDLGEEAQVAETSAGDDEGPEWPEYFDDGADLGLAPVRKDPERRPVEPRAQEPSLREHLMVQLRGTCLTLEELRLAEFVVASLDDDGYLRDADLPPHLDAPAGMFERVLSAIQSCDPPGVGARDLRECLLLQLGARGCRDEVAWTIVECHLQELAGDRLRRIAGALAVEVQAVEQAARVIRSLNPRPGANYGCPQVGYIVADLSVERVGREYVVVLNDGSIPHLSISRYYRRLAREVTDAATRAYLLHRLRSATYLVRSVEQRRMTLYRVMESIVGFQRGFFDGGIRCLRPLTLRQVGDELSLHESTVSRAVSNKHVQTPHGLFPMRFFFSSGVPAGWAKPPVSAESVKVMIRDLVSAEDRQHPLSDASLASRLGEEGIAISRRTVAKYREAAAIPASARRRRA